MMDRPIYTTDKVGYADPERMLKWQNESLLHPRLKAKNEYIKELETALQAIESGDVEKMLEFIQSHGAVLPEMEEIYNDQRWQPESYELEGDYADDARYNYPNRMRLIRGVCQAALSMQNMHK